MELGAGRGRFWLAVGACTAVAAAVRLVGLDVQSLWHDELFVAWAAGQPTLADIVRVGAIEDVHPPLYVLAMAGWTRLAGDGEVALRLPSAVAGTLAVPWLAALGARWLSPRAGVGAAALAAVAWMPVYYAQEGRPYAWLFLGTIVLADAASRAAAAPSAARLAEVAVVSLLLAWLHYFGLLIATLVLAAGLAHALRRGGARPWAMTAAAVALGVAPWGIVLAGQVGRGEVWIPPPRWRDIVHLYAAMANGSLLALVGVLAAGAAAARRRSDVVVGLVVLGLVAWATAPVVAALALSWLVLPVFTERNLIVALPPVLLLAGAALAAVDRAWARGWPVATALVCVALLVDLVVVRDYYRVPTKWQYREVAQDLAADATGREEALVVSGAWHPAYFDHYLVPLGGPRVDVTAHGADEIAAAVAAADADVVYVTVPVPHRRRRPPAPLVLEGFDARWTREYVGWDLVRFDRRR